MDAQSSGHLASRAAHVIAGHIGRLEALEAGRAIVIGWQTSNIGVRLGNDVGNTTVGTLGNRAATKPLALQRLDAGGAVWAGPGLARLAAFCAGWCQEGRHPPRALAIPAHTHPFASITIRESVGSAAAAGILERQATVGCAVEIPSKGKTFDHSSLLESPNQYVPGF